MKNFKKIMALAIVMLIAISTSPRAFAQDNNGNYSEYDKNNSFSVKYNKLASKAKDADELVKIIESLGFEKNKEIKTITYYNEIDGRLVKSNMKKIIEDGLEKFYIDDKEVTTNQFNNANLAQINNSELTMTMTSYKGDPHDPSINNKMQLVYNFTWNTSIMPKPYTDLYGALWDDTAVYSTNIIASSGLVYKSTGICSRAFKVPNNINSGYINVLLNSRDGYVFDDHGNAISEYQHATNHNPEWDASLGVGFTIANILNISVSHNVAATITPSVADFTF